MNAELIATYARLDLIDQLLPALKQRYQHTGRKREWCRCGECDGCLAEEKLCTEVWALEDAQEELSKRLSEEFTPVCADPAPRHISWLVGLVEEGHSEAYDLFSPEEKKAYDAYANEMADEYAEFIASEFAAQEVDLQLEQERLDALNEDEEYWAQVRKDACDERSFDF